MADITAAMVKDLREKSGAGMMDCKKALNETGGDMDAALDWLRTKGLAAAAKKSSRTAAEGLVGIATSGTKGAAVEVNSETDFVAKNDQFQDFVREVTQIALATGGDVDSLKGEKMPSGTTVEEVLTNNIATIGENQSLRRSKRLEVSKGAVVGYVHNQQAPGLGKIGVLVALESEASDEVLQSLGKQLAMHVAAAFPKALNEEDLDEAEIERERAIAAEKAGESGKPADIIAKMVEGSIAKYRKEHALVSQLFVMDGKTRISDVVAKAGKDAGTPIVLKDYVRFQLGEGIEKEASDFAAEVAAASGVPQNKQAEPTA
ncbi:translation elongation factor Ts [Sphingomonas sp. IC-11]|uniref:translation elongation factor Ts n=1 Tax=Sphingomonas sp. IC-11 TaxID=2898528 RepID=UPI001E333D8F|nr:translation elongation factor Ts [Sphingomonas sp. IC-11]MCD2315866.1 translation elongation factor Ts [Sphingomonas sp. IC-11]